MKKRAEIYLIKVNKINRSFSRSESFTYILLMRVARVRNSFIMHAYKYTPSGIFIFNWWVYFKNKSFWVFKKRKNIQNENSLRIDTRPLSIETRYPEMYYEFRMSYIHKYIPYIGSNSQIHSKIFMFSLLWVW